MSSSFNRLRALLADFARRRDGVVALLFALLLPVLLAFMLGLIDYTRASTTQMALQTNLDAAALYIARSNATTQADVTAMGKRMMDANVENLKHGKVASYSFTLTSDQRVVATAEATVPVTIASLLGKSQVPVEAAAEVTRNSNSVEVGLALDITGSMAGQKLTDLKAAAKSLIDLVVKDQQTPYYSKVALVPYSMGVNAGTYANQVRGTYSSGTSTSPGRQKYSFTNADGDPNTVFTITTCVTERLGAQAYSDASPTGAFVGRHYTRDGKCSVSSLIPLTSNRTTLKNTVEGFTANGPTAGHIGLAWGWYMISPNFASLFSGEGKPAAYNTRDLLKVVVLMTDGLFNTPYCKGVVSKDSKDDNSISKEDRNNCNAENGSSSSQASTLCTNMKTAGVIVYTVGFAVGSNTDVKTMLTNCATSANHVYFPASGAALKDAFTAIGQEINSLRISK